MTRTVFVWLRLSAVLLALCVARRAQASDLRHLFAKSATVEIVTRGPGTLVRLPLPTEVLATCRADLSDLRLIDEHGAETAFVLDRGAPPPAAPTKLKTLAAPALAAENHEITRPGAQSLLQESYEFAAPPAAPKSGSWELVLEVALPEFVRRLDLEAAYPDGRRVLLKANDSVFRLRNGHGERLRIPLPSVLGPRLRVNLVGEATTPLQPRFHFEAVESLESPPVAAVELVPVDISTSIGRTRVQLARPSGLVPSALRLETTTSAFSRAVEVRDLGGAGQAELLGSAAVFRIQGLSLFEKLEVSLEPARGNLLEVSIEDGDSLPLEALKVSALIRAPSLVFSLPTASEAARAPTLYFGGGRAHAPRYDLATLVVDGASDGPGERARAAHSLFDPAQVSLARLQAMRENPEYDRAPALKFAQHAGAALDARVYTHRRRVEVTPSADGVAEIPLTAQDLSLLRADLGDVRVVDGAGRQWPFLLQAARRDELVPLSLGELKREGRSSSSALRLPFAPLSLSALVLDTRDTYFDRSYRLEAELPNGRKTELQSGRLTRAAEGAPLALLLEFSPVRVQGLVLTVEDGDNAPLSLGSIRARVSVPSLLVVAEKGSYELLFGNPAAEPASYDIENARSLVLSVAAQQSSPLAVEPNPAYRAAARLGGGGGRERIALWLALGLAVLLLGAMTFRLIQRQGDGGSPKTGADS